MNKQQRLEDERRHLSRAMRSYQDAIGSRSWSAIETATWDGMLARLGPLDIEIAAADRANAADQLSRRGIAVRDSVFDRWVRAGEGGLSGEQLQAFRNTMSTTTNSQGGYTVPLAVGPEWMSSLKAASAVRQVARVIPDAPGDLSWPLSDIGSEVGERLAQNASASAQDPSFGTANLTASKYSSLIVTVPIELLQDAAIDMVAYLIERLTARIARVTNPDFTVGTGTSQPQGFVTGSSVGKTGLTGQTVTIIFDDLVDLIGSVDAAYRTTQIQGVAFQMADTSWRVVRKLKDSQGRPLFLPDETADGERLMGYAVKINNDIAAMAANAKSVAFGNFTHGYVIADAMDVELYRLADSAYAKLGQVGFLAFARSGGAVVDAAAIKLYQNSAT